MASFTPTLPYRYRRDTWPKWIEVCLHLDICISKRIYVIQTSQIYQKYTFSKSFIRFISKYSTCLPPISISLMLAFYGLISLLWKQPIYITKYEFNYCKLHQLNNCLHVNESSHYRPCPKSFIITWKYHMQSFHLLWLLSFLCCI